MSVMDCNRSPRYGFSSVLTLAVTDSPKSTPNAVSLVNLTRERINGSLAMRSFIAHTAGVFLAFRSSMSEGANESRRSVIARVSRLYRSALSQLNETRYPGFEVFRVVEIVWHLSEVLVLDLQSPGVLIQQLQQWAAASSSSTMKRLAALEAEKSCHKIETNLKDAEAKQFKYNEDTEQAYWDTLTSLVMHGQIEDACAVLRLHRLWGRDDFSLMAKILESMPVYGESASTPLHFLDQWNEWQDTVRQVIEEGRFGDDTDFLSACRLIVGDADEFDRRKELCDSWFHFFVAKTSYSQPLVKVEDLRKLADQVLDAGDYVSSDPLSQLVLALFRMDLNHFTRLIADLDDMWWTATHLIDLLLFSGDLHRYNVQHAEARHEQLLQDYVLYLFSQRPLWETGLLYLQHLPNHEAKRTMMVEALNNVDCTSQQKVLKVAAIADMLGLPEVSAAVYRVQGVKWLKRGKLDAALSWAIRSRNQPLISRVAEMVLEGFLRTGQLACADQLDSLGQVILLSDRLSFLAKYAHFLRLRELCVQAEDALTLKSANARAGELLLLLVDFQWAPKFFQSRLLEDALRLLEGNGSPPLNIAYLQKVMQCIQNMIKDSPTEISMDFIRRLNAACATKLAHSFIQVS